MLCEAMPSDSVSRPKADVKCGPILLTNVGKSTCAAIVVSAPAENVAESCGWS